MLGRVRPSPCSLDCLELERPASKLIKGDTLSIYEATLQKLRLGSRRALISPSEEPMKIDTPICSASVSPSSSNAQSQSIQSPSNQETEDDSCTSTSLQT